MLALYLGARLFYRQRSMLNAIGAAALGVLIVDPKALLGASFQLTFLCVLLIAAIGVPLLERTSQPFLRGLRNLQSANYDWVLPPKVAQFRLDLRALASRFEFLLGTQTLLPLGIHFSINEFDGFEEAARSFRLPNFSKSATPQTFNKNVSGNWFGITFNPDHHE